mmetsp:Transcript_17128/g.65368  ORF Transcript_17128/g.65368 Transcript_17128/m.65368 type:complete len:94 (+) Transcript_17128:320-601(+)
MVEACSGGGTRENMSELLGEKLCRGRYEVQRGRSKLPPAQVAWRHVPVETERGCAEERLQTKAPSEDCKLVGSKARLSWTGHGGVPRHGKSRT